MSPTLQQPARHDRAQSPGDFNVALNGYRGICALLVFFYHLANANVVAWPHGATWAEATTFFVSSFRYGVEMFFMISGFVILGSLLRHKTVGGFLKDRFVRIFCAWVPTLLAVTAVCIVFDMKVFANLSPLESFGVFVANLLLLPPVIPLPMVHAVSWSLTYEWVFYLTAAVGALLYRHTPQRSWAIALWVGFAALFICAFPRALFFVTGVIVFKYHAWFANHIRWLRFPLVSLLVFLIAWRYTDVGKAHLSYTFLDMFTDGRWVAAVIAFFASLHMFAAVCLHASRSIGVLTTRTMQFLGTISYSFYLWHSLVISLMKRIVVPVLEPDYGIAVAFIVMSIASLAISIPLSWASWTLFEVRLAKIVRSVPGRRFVGFPPLQSNRGPGDLQNLRTYGPAPKRGSAR